MSVTELLRAMLDERGVEWWNGHGDCDGHAGTLWDGIGGRWYAGGMTGVCGCRLYLETPADRTPEQAIAATLGAGTCHVKTVKKIGDSFGFSLSCGHSMVNPFNDRPDYCPWCGAKVVDE